MRSGRMMIGFAVWLAGIGQAAEEDPAAPHAATLPPALREPIARISWSC